MMLNKKIAITGGIGSGKTLFCNFLRDFGCPVFSCDEISAELWKDADYLNGLKKLFPQFISEGKLQKDKLTACVFANSAMRKKLEAYAHPCIMKRLIARMEEFSISFAEVPLLFEGGYEHLFDDVIILMRSDDARIRAVCNRDNLSKAQVQSRMAAQKDWSTFQVDGAYLIENDGTSENLRQKAAEFIEQFKI